MAKKKESNPQSVYLFVQNTLDKASSAGAKLATSIMLQLRVGNLGDIFVKTSNACRAWINNIILSNATYM